MTTNQKVVGSNPPGRAKRTVHFLRKMGRFRFYVKCGGGAKKQLYTHLYTQMRKAAEKGRRKRLRIYADRRGVIPATAMSTVEKREGLRIYADRRGVIPATAMRTVEKREGLRIYADRRGVIPATAMRTVEKRERLKIYADRRRAILATAMRRRKAQALANLHSRP